MGEKKPRQTVIKHHVKGCWALAKYGGEWLIESLVWLKRDRSGRKRPHGNDRRFVLFRCNDASCPAQMIILEADVCKRCGVARR